MPTHKLINAIVRHTGGFGTNINKSLARQQDFLACGRVVDPVGTLITERPPDRPGRARLRIRFL
jgi:hypothetical protein